MTGINEWVKMTFEFLRVILSKIIQYKISPYDKVLSKSGHYVLLKLYLMTGIKKMDKSDCLDF